MKQENVIRALEILAEVQRSSAPITLKIGATSKGNMVEHGEIVLLNACPAAIRALSKAGFTLYMSEEFGGLALEDYTIKDGE